MYVVICWPEVSFTNLYPENDQEARELRTFRDWLKAGAQTALIFIEHLKWANDFQFLESPSYSNYPPLTSNLEEAFKFQSLGKAEKAQKHLENSCVLTISQAAQRVAKRGY